MTRRAGWRARVTAWSNGRKGFRPGSIGGIGTPAALVDSEFLRKLDRLALQIGPDLIGGLLGEHRARRRTTGIEFADYRPYSPGDDPRRVDWNAYARLGTLLVRQAQAEHDTALYLLLDASPSMAYGDPAKSWAAARLAAALGYIALAHLDSVVLAAPGMGGGWDRAEARQEPEVGPDFQADLRLPQATILRGQAEAGRLFRLLAGVQPARAADWGEVLRGWSVGHGPGRCAVVLSDLLLDGYQAGVRQLLGTGCAVTIIHILSADELHPADEGDLELVDSETGLPLEVHLGRESLVAYHEHLSAWLGETEAWCRRYGVGYVRVESGWDMERVLLDTLRRRGVTA